MSSPAPSPSEPGSPPGSLTPFLKALKSGDLETLSKLRHALRTPLNQIIGYSEMLMESAEENNAAGIVPDLKRIHSSGGQLLAIINDALAPWKIDSGRIDFPSMRLAMQGPLAAVVTQANQCLERSRASGHTELVQDLDKILTAAQNLEKLFNSSTYLSLLYLATSMILVPYFWSAAYALLLAWRHETYEQAPGERGKDLLIALIAVLYAVWLVYAAGVQYLLLSALLYAPGAILFAKAKRELGQPVFTSVEKLIFAAVVIGALVAAYGLYDGFLTL